LCSLSGSYDLQKLRELYKLNAYRGVLSSSLAIFDEDSELVSLCRFRGKIPEEVWDDERMNAQSDNEKVYFLCHSQAPTTSEDANKTIHPSEYQGQLLWHNGIIKTKSIDEWNLKLGTAYKWDTAQLNHIIATYGFSALSEVNGCFACVMHTLNRVYLFRNEISPLFIDDKLNISSTKFEGGSALPANTVYELDIRNEELLETTFNFITLENPYHFGVN
jgi:hypothetical protein